MPWRWWFNHMATTWHAMVARLLLFKMDNGKAVQVCRRPTVPLQGRLPEVESASCIVVHRCIMRARAHRHRASCAHVMKVWSGVRCVRCMSLCRYACCANLSVHMHPAQLVHVEVSGAGRSLLNGTSPVHGVLFGCFMDAASLAAWRFSHAGMCRHMMHTLSSCMPC
jgi:hypothetical protein